VPSSATSRDVTVEVLPGGKVLLLTWAVPVFFLYIDRLGFETDGNVDDLHSQSIAYQEGVRELRAHANERVLIPMEYMIPIRVEEQLTPDDINYIAFPIPILITKPSLSAAWSFTFVVSITAQPNSIVIPKRL
jgi:hypothetical protein